MCGIVVVRVFEKQFVFYCCEVALRVAYDCFFVGDDRWSYWNIKKSKRDFQNDKKN